MVDFVRFDDKGHLVKVSLWFDPETGRVLQGKRLTFYPDGDINEETVTAISRNCGEWIREEIKFLEDVLRIKAMLEGHRASIQAEIDSKDGLAQTVARLKLENQL